MIRADHRAPLWPKVRSALRGEPRAAGRTVVTDWHPIVDCDVDGLDLVSVEVRHQHDGRLMLWFVAPRAAAQTIADAIHTELDTHPSRRRP